MNSIFTRLRASLFTEGQNIHVRHFNLLALTGIASSALIGVVSLFTTSPKAAAACFLLCAAAIGLLIFSVRTGHYQFCYRVTVIGIFLIGFSFLFFIGGGIRSGSIQFFIFAVVFTALLLEGRDLVVMIAAEIVVYAADFLLARQFPSLVAQQLAEGEQLWDILASTLLVAVSLGLAVTMNVRSYRRQHEELKHAKRAADEANAAKTVFLGNITHELRTPLTVISGYAQTCGKTLLSLGETEEADRMRFISTECDRLAMLVSQLLDVTRIEEGKLMLRKKAVQADELVKRTLDAYSPIIKQHGNRLVFHRLYDCPPVNADEDRLRQVLLNLLTNAAKHTENGTVTVDMAQERGMLAISVSDTGEGIPAEVLPTLFERFSKTENRTANDTGTGLGLYISKHIVEAHGGTISVQSAAGEGTSVRFTLPI